MRLLSLLAVLVMGVGIGRAQIVVGFDGNRGGSYNLQAQNALRGAITDALPGATFSYTGTLSAGVLANAAGVVIMSPHDNSNPITPLSGAEQSALAAFVLAGGFAIVATDSDYVPTNFDATNDSFLAPFGFSADGAYSAPITITNPSGNPISNGPFGLVTSIAGTATGSYAGLPGAFQSLGTSSSAGNPISAGYFARGALGAGSGAVLFIADANALHTAWSSPANYDLVSNFVAFAAIPEPATHVLLAGGAVGLLWLEWRRRRNRD